MSAEVDHDGAELRIPPRRASVEDTVLLLFPGLLAVGPLTAACAGAPVPAAALPAGLPAAALLLLWLGMNRAAHTRVWLDARTLRVERRTWLGRTRWSAPVAQVAATHDPVAGVVVLRAREESWVIAANAPWLAQLEELLAHARAAQANRDAVEGHEYDFQRKTAAEVQALVNKRTDEPG